MTDQTLPPVVPVQAVAERLPLVFPEGIDHRGYLVRDIAARTIFVMLYTGAVEGSGRWLRPNQVTRMTDKQAGRVSDDARLKWTAGTLLPAKGAIQGRWYADNTREPIRDETIRLGLLAVGAAVERPGLPVTSSLPRYALASDFADLFTCRPEDFSARAETWRSGHLTSSALARLRLLHAGAVSDAGKSGHVLVSFPNGETRRLSPGPSSIVSKAVIEEFAPSFLRRPGVVFLSESRQKVVARDEALARLLGLDISPDKLLPDIILVDLGPQRPLIVFVEVVATDGPVDDKRKAGLSQVATQAGHAVEDLAFVTAFMDKSETAWRKASSSIAWGSFVWFASQPASIIWYRGECTEPLSALMGSTHQKHV